MGARGGQEGGVGWGVIGRGRGGQVDPEVFAVWVRLLLRVPNRRAGGGGEREREGREGREGGREEEREDGRKGGRDAGRERGRGEGRRLCPPARLLPRRLAPSPGSPLRSWSAGSHLRVCRRRARDGAASRPSLSLSASAPAPFRAVATRQTGLTALRRWTGLKAPASARPCATAAASDGGVCVWGGAASCGCSSSTRGRRRRITCGARRRGWG